MYQEYEMTSLCQVGTESLYRFADLVDGKFVPFYKNPSERAIFENRDYLPCRDCPLEANKIGVFDWKATENISTPGNDYITTAYKDIVPMEVIKLSEKTSFSDYLLKLRDGLDRRYLGCNYLIVKNDAVWKNDGVGIFISRSNIDFDGRKIRLSPDVFELNQYEIQMKDILKLGNGVLIYTYPEPGNIIKKIPARSMSDYIKYYFTSNATWTKLKALGSTKADWKILKQYLDTYSTDSLIDELTRIYPVERVEAKLKIDEFVSDAEKNIKKLPIDADDLKTIILGIPSLKETALVIGKDEWQKENLEKLQGLNKNILEIQKKINKASDGVDEKRVIEEYKEKEKTLTDKLEKIESEVLDKENRVAELENEIKEKEKKLESVNDSLAEKDVTVDAIRKSISEKLDAARKDIAGFVAEQEIYLSVNGSSKTSAAREESSAFIKGKELPKEDIEEENSISDLIDILSEELETAGVSKDHSRLMSTYLTGTILKKENLLLLGPCGMDIANAVSASIEGKYVDCIDCSVEFDKMIIDDIREHAGRIVSVKYPFSPGWVDKIPDIIRDTDRNYILVHPYYEDMLIEPESFYNYAKPLITTPFVEHVKTKEFLGGLMKLSKGLKPDGNAIPEVSAMLKASGMKGFTGSSLLSEEKMLLGNFISEKDVKESMMLFAALPYAIVTGREDAFFEAIKDTNTYKAHRRLIEETIGKQNE